MMILGALAAAGLASAAAAQPASGYQSPWGRCCGARAWPQGPGMGSGMMGPGMMGPGGAMARNRAAMMGAMPAAYARLSNPLPQTAATVEHGARVYAANCESCHGVTGFGDGPAGRTLSPPPANLAWLSRMPMSRWDSLMYWTVAEGGAPVGSAMPAFKQSLSDKDIWSVIAYIQARLPVTHAR
jgi:mono/diheme cytochrome c family protein